MLAGMLSAVLTVTALPLASLAVPQKEVKAASVTLQNPRIVKDDSMKARQKVTWDCIWFGSYPQREVVADAAGYDAIYEDYYNPQTDIIEDAALFQKLERASGWSNNEIVLDGNKYRRMKQEDATYSNPDSEYEAYYYRWKDNTSWHYFRYEPIKWRVLSTAGDQAFLQADLALDDQKYNNNYTSVTWESSSMRSWLNGYGPEKNEPKMDYRSDSFLQDAFTSAGQQVIRTTEVENADNLEYGTEGGNHTTDKIFLLSEQEVYGTKAGSYGFAEAYGTNDEARRRKSSTYAKAKGVWSNYGEGAGYDGNCWWWLRTPGDYTLNTMEVHDPGYVDRYGDNVPYNDNGVCPALNLNLSSSNLWSYAGTVCSDGTAKEQAASWTPQEKESEKQPESQKQTESQKQPEKEENLPKAGDMIRTNDAVYRITKMAATGNTVTLEKPLKKTNRTFNVPASIKSADGKTIFRVTGIAKNAFRKNTKLAKVVLGGNLAKIGANAFAGCKNLKTIRIASTSLTKKSVGKNAFKGIHKKAVIKVPKKKLKAYRKFLKGKGQAKSVKITE